MVLQLSMGLCCSTYSLLFIDPSVVILRVPTPSVSLTNGLEPCCIKRVRRPRTCTSICRMKSFKVNSTASLLVLMTLYSLFATTNLQMYCLFKQESLATAQYVEGSYYCNNGCAWRRLETGGFEFCTRRHLTSEK